jgi:hypothetical protein
MSVVSSSATNTFKNGSSSPDDFTSQQQTLIEVLQQLRGVFYLNFEAGNTAALGLKAGSKITVNFKEYSFTTTALFDVIKSDGSVVTADNADDGDYIVIFKANDDDTCTGYLYQTAESNVSINANYGGLYITNTQYRVVGGVTKSGTTHTKWLYVYNDNLVQKIYPDGLFSVTREIIGCTNIGKSLGSVLSSHTQRVYQQEDQEDLGTFDISYPQTIKIIDTHHDDAYIHGSIKYRLGIEIDGSTSIIPTTLGSGESIFVGPGKYHLIVYVSLGSSWSGDVTFSEDMYLDSFRVVASNVFGSKTGSY